MSALFFIIDNKYSHNILKKLGLKFYWKNIIAAIILCAMMIIESCNAPRNNPLDLLSSGYSFAELSGTVYTLPYSGIPGVSVYWSPSDKLVLTDNNGNFQINNILPVNGELIFQKNGYISDTVNVNWGNAKVWNSN